jgi:pseudaminic acid cytidylyltransferase
MTAKPARSIGATRSVAVIPARGGSKRIPRKNVRLMSGRPLIAWTIDTALESGLFDQVVVSTDDEEIATVSRESGATVPFIRSPELADDQTGTAAVVIDAINQLAATGSTYDSVCCLYPASIFVTPVDIVETQRMLVEQDSADFLLTVARFDAPIERALYLSNENRVAPVNPEFMGSRTQDLPTRYRDVGQLYWGRSQAWLDGRSVFDNSIGYVLENARVQDIDTEEDWQLAQLLHTVGRRSVREEIPGG